LFTLAQASGTGRSDLHGLAFRPGEASENAIAPEDVADAIIAMLGAPPGTVVDEINLSPLKKVIRFGPAAGV